MVPETLEAEIIEVDGEVLPAQSTAGGGAETRSAPAWDPRRVRGTVLNLDRRWWPLWLLLGLVAMVLAATLGLVFGAIYLVLSVFRKLIRVVASPLVDPQRPRGAYRG